MSAPPPFRGVAVALVTLFDDTGALDAPASARLAAELAGLGVHAIVVAGTTGEAMTLDEHERGELLAAVRAAVPVGTLPVVAGTGAPSAHQAVRHTRQARDAGADAVLALSPPQSRDLAGYYTAVRAAAGDLAVLAYHYPAVSAPGIGLEALASLPVDGVKDSTGDAGRLLATLEAFDRPCYAGSGALLALAGPLGCAGAIVAAANACPERCAAAFAGDVEAQRALAGPEGRLAAEGTAGIKALTAQRFGTSTVCRLS